MRSYDRESGGVDSAAEEQKFLRIPGLERVCVMGAKRSCIRSWSG